MGFLVTVFSTSFFRLFNNFYLDLRMKTSINYNTWLLSWNGSCSSILFFRMGERDDSYISLHVSESDIEIVPGDFVKIGDDCEIKKNSGLFLSES